jgi:hypothetical protein
VFGGAAVEPGARGEVGAGLPGAADGAELVPSGAVGAADPGTTAGSGAGAVPGAPAEAATVVGVVEDDSRLMDVDVDRLAWWSSAFA